MAHTRPVTRLSERNIRELPLTSPTNLGKARIPHLFGAISSVALTMAHMCCGVMGGEKNMWGPATLHKDLIPRGIPTHSGFLGFV